MPESKKLSFTYENKIYQSFTREDAISIGIPEDILDTVELELAWKDLRDKRDSLLTETDWTQVGDCPLKDNVDWLNYRQQLRDLPDVVTDPNNVIWPTKPA